MLSILIIEDDPNIRLFYKVNLQQRGFKVIPAQDPENALISLQQELPSMILLDMNFSGMDGNDFLEYLAHNPRLKNIPVIIVTAMIYALDPVQAQYPNVVSLLTKPFSVGILIETVLAVQNSREQRKNS